MNFRQSLYNKPCTNNPNEKPIIIFGILKNNPEKHINKYINQ